MGVDSKTIIERQLQLLLDRSEKGVLGFEEVQTLERLVKMQMLLRLKGPSKSLDDPYEDISSDELKKALTLLGT